MFSHKLHMFGLVVSDREDFKIFSPAQAIILIDLEKMFFFFVEDHTNIIPAKFTRLKWFQRRKLKCLQTDSRWTSSDDKASNEQNKSRF